MRRLVLLSAVLAAALPGAGYGRGAGNPECRTILPPTGLPAGKRPLEAEDLARLRDIGPVEPAAFAAPLFTISPDGRQAAFQLRQGDPKRNSYCVAMVIVNLSGKQRPTIVDEGADPLLLTLDFRGIADHPIGVFRPITPRWSRNGKWIAFLKRSGGTTQVWRAFADGSGSAPLTRSDLDVVDFRVAPDGASIVFATRPGLARQRREFEREGRSGWQYDERFIPFVSKRPLPRAPAERQIQVLDGVTGKVRAPTAEESAMVAVDRDIIALAGAAAAIDGPGLEITATNLSGGAQAGALRARLANGLTASCTSPACEGARTPWWMAGNRNVRFLRREGWANASTAIYEWDVGTGSVRRLYLTDDVLSSCTPAAEALICLVDSSLEPRRLVKLDPANGRRELLFDPNPEFSRLTLGRPERLKWRNAFGVETIADLVLPVGYRKGQRYPMVVVQYDTRGFLRGGTGDEYPIQAFANRGYAVLSFKRPQFPSDRQGAKDFEEAGRLDLEKFADRRSVHSSLEAGVGLVVERSIADPRRIGVTGLSDGASTLDWALIHSSLFSAAATSSCCWDSTFLAGVGPSAARHFRAEGYPGILGRSNPFWKEISLAENAHRISTPILVNASEQEFLAALVTFTALREAGVPIDMFVYPDEYHVRWQPAHRLATYRRSLDWFDYWLRGIRSDAPERQSELKEWDRLKEQAERRRSQ